jgi:hypothetical protein
MFTQRQVNKIFSHVPTRTLRQWSLDGFYQWSEETEDGRGTGRHYELVHVYQIGIAEVLARANFHADRIRRIMRQFFVEKIYQNELIALEKMQGFLIVGETLIGKNRGFQAGTCKRDELEKTLELLDGWILRTVIDLSAIKQLVDHSLQAH